MRTAIPPRERLSLALRLLVTRESFNFGGYLSSSESSSEKSWNPSKLFTTTARGKILYFAILMDTNRDSTH